MTILQALNWGKEQLKEVGSHSNPMLDAQILLAGCLNKPTAYLFGHFEDNIADPITEKYQRFISRRKRQEPVSQILGQKEFFNRVFVVNPSVLTPRPETEQLVEEALKIIDEKSTIIDVGTGSGAIAVTLAAETRLPIVAIDIDEQALSVAKHNAAKYSVEHLVSFLAGNLLEPYFQKNIHTPESNNAIIVANLPYLTVNQWLLLDSDVREYEPKRALVGGIDGLDFYDKLLQQIKEHRDLFPKILYLLIEIDPAQHLSAPNLILEYFSKSEIVVEYDLAGKVRMVIAKL